MPPSCRLRTPFGAASACAARGSRRGAAAATAATTVQPEPSVPEVDKPMQDEGQEADKQYDEERYTAYRYVVNVEFGSMSFYYDWGRWNVDDIAYVADSTSRDGAATTPDGAPGWYGFDGLANRIGINYRRIGSEVGTEYLQVSLHFDFARDELTAAPLYTSDHMALSLYDTADFGTLTARMEAANAYTASLVIAPGVDDASTPTVDEAEIMQDYYLSIEGAPMRADATRYENGTPATLGVLTLRIDFTSTQP